MNLYEKCTAKLYSFLVIDTTLNTISTEKQQKYQYYHQVIFINMINNRIIEQATFTYSRLGKALEKQAKTIEDQGKK